MDVLKAVMVVQDGSAEVLAALWHARPSASARAGVSMGAETPAELETLCCFACPHPELGRDPWIQQFI